MIPLLAAAPTIDADLAEWSSVPAIAVAHPLVGKASATAAARIARAGDTLFVAVHVQDDHFLPGGDHVELWIGEPGALDEEAVATDELRDQLEGADEFAARQLQSILSERRQGRPEQHLVFGVSTVPTRLVPVETAAELPSAVRIASEGWNAELAVPLTELRRVSTLDLSQLAVRVDVIDADPGVDATGTLSSAPGRAVGRIPVYPLTPPISLGSMAAWTDLGLLPPSFSPRDGAWQPVSSGTSWIQHTPVSDSFAPTNPPTAELIPGPIPLRLVDGERLDQTVGGAWTKLAEGSRGVSATWHHNLVFVTASEPENVDPMGMCGAADRTTWRVLRWANGALTEIWARSSSTCDEHATDCELVGDRLTCEDAAGDHGCWRLGRQAMSVVPCPLTGPLPE